MPVSLTIEDGPSSSPWMSPAIVPGRLNGNSFTPASGNALSRGTTYDFKVTVRNRGNEETTPPLGTGPTGPFVPATSMAVGGVSPSGTSRAAVSNSAGFPELQLIVGTTVVWTQGLGRTTNPSLPRDHVFGYDPTGKVFVCVTDDPGGYQVQAVAAETIGSGVQRLQPGQVIATTQVTASTGTGLWASSGLGFVPMQDTLFLAYASSAGQTEIELWDLRPGISQRRASISGIAPPQAGQIRFSPSGDVLALIGQPSGIHNAILLYATPGLTLLPWTRRGMPAPQLAVQLPFSIRSVKPSGFEAIEVRSGPDTVLLDSPTPSLPAVAVYLWVDTSSSVFDTRTARQYPASTAGSQQPPSGFIDRIGSGPGTNERSVLIDANWTATLPPAGQHFCAIAEVFTTAGTTPADPRQRVGTALSLIERQIAQRNLVVM